MRTFLIFGLITLQLAFKSIVSQDPMPDPYNPIPLTGCFNFNDTLCTYWTQTLMITNGCPSNAYLEGIPFSTYCCKACSCLDTQPSCFYWSNYCSLLANFNPHPCPRTCNMCPNESIQFNHNSLSLKFLVDLNMFFYSFRFSV